MIGDYLHFPVLACEIVGMEREMGSGENREIETENLEENGGLPDDMKRLPPWEKQITVRGIIAGLFIGMIYSVVLMKLNLSTGLLPNLNVSAALLAFVVIRTWTTLLEKSNFTTTPFTRQENTVIQTCAVACYGLAYGGQHLHHWFGFESHAFDLVLVYMSCFCFKHLIW